MSLHAVSIGGTGVKTAATAEVDPVRRRCLAAAGSAAGLLGLGYLLPRTARADVAPHVASTDPVAIALHYVEDASTLDPTKNPTHLPGTNCASCKLYQGRRTDPYGPCQLFPGKVVSSRGWCMGYQKR
jgi:hypothetical protein